MKTKKFLKIISFVFGFGLLLIGCFLGYNHYQHKDGYNVDKNKFPHEVGYINPKDAKFTENFSLCDNTYLYGHYSSAAPKIYKGTKYTFRKMINETYKNLNYTDTGFLNLRFHINCKGNVGNVEINKLNIDYEITDLNNAMVNQLVELTVNEENWAPISQKGIRRDVYMYLIFKIENGDVVEILP